VAVLALIDGLKEIAQDEVGWTTAMALLCGLASCLAFVRRQQRLSDPLIDVRLFGNRTFAAALTGNTLDFFVGFGINLFIAQYLQLVLGLSPLAAGLWLVPSAGGFIVGSLLTPWFVRRMRPAYAMAAGMGLTAAGFGVLTQIHGAWSLPMLVIGSLVVSLGMAPMTTLSTDIMVGAAPPEQAGAASGISETSSEFGGALGIAVLGSIGTVSYRGSVANALPAGLPHGAMEAARDTLGGAVAAAGHLSERTSADLLHVAREAFTSSFELVAGVCVAISIGAALLAAACLRHVGVDAGRELH
jgi:DHA2 family multidrug resistance protein-like MFS transporter